MFNIIVSAVDDIMANIKILSGFWLAIGGKGRLCGTFCLTFGFYASIFLYFLYIIKSVTVYIKSLFNCVNKDDHKIYERDQAYHYYMNLTQAHG